MARANTMQPQTISTGEMQPIAPINPTQTKFKGMSREQAKLEVAKMVERQREKDSELVTGRFKNFETPGGSVFFNIHLYPGDDFKAYELRDGEMYRLPRGVARHLNTNCFYREYRHLPGQAGQEGLRSGPADGRPRAQDLQMSQKVHRYGFFSTEYTDDDLDMQPGKAIIEVTHSM